MLKKHMLLKRLITRLRDLRKTDPDLAPLDERERAASYPPPFPDGWYKIADAAELPRGRVRHIQCLGHRWALFRSDRSDELGLLDAICPHQGANLAGGALRDGCLECPFHHWQLATDGQVTKVPYAAHVPPSLRATSWPVREYHGMIVAYHSSQRGRGPFAPPYDLPPIAALSSPSMVFRGAYDHPRPVRMHLIEFAENSADFQHFAPLHGRMHVPWTRWRLPLIVVRHSPTWEIDPERPFISAFCDDAHLELAGRPLPSTNARASITFLGPGSVTVFQINVPKLGDVVLFHTNTPIAPLEQQVQFRWYAERRIPRILVSYLVGSWIAQWRNDIAIWENKYFQRRPMLLPDDGPILRLRRWYKQFYPAGVELAQAQATAIEA
jgi:cholesterol 7-dehydrogenase